MKLKLKKKYDSSDKDSLIVMVKAPAYYCDKVAIGQCIDVEDELGYSIMNTYRGCFEQAGSQPMTEEKTLKGGYKDKSTHAE